jgi:hypothetical protein
MKKASTKERIIAVLHLAFEGAAENMLLPAKQIREKLLSKELLEMCCCQQNCYRRSYCEYAAAEKADTRRPLAGSEAQCQSIEEIWVAA